MKRIYEYLCEVHGMFEFWSEPDFRYNPKECPKCSTKSTFQVSSPTVKLPGWCDTFPSASLKWEALHRRECSKVPEPTE